MSEASDPRFVERLARTALSRAYQIAVSLVASRAEAEDAVQDALARALEKAGSLRNPDAAEPWFLRMVTNQCLKILRRRRLRQRLLAPFGATSPPEWITDLPSADILLDKRAELRRTLEHLDELPAKQRAAVVLRYGHDMPVSQVAELLGVSPATAKTHLVRALRALRRRMEKQR